MARIGTVQELWRYPVKSMVGEQLAQTTIASNGLPGDRGWALRDEAAGEIRGGKKLPELMRCSARYLREPGEGDVPPAEITFPDGSSVTTDDAPASRRGCRSSSAARSRSGRSSRRRTATTTGAGSPTSPT